MLVVAWDWWISMPFVGLYFLKREATSDSQGRDHPSQLLRSGKKVLATVSGRSLIGYSVKGTLYVCVQCASMFFKLSKYLKWYSIALSHISPSQWCLKLRNSCEKPWVLHPWRAAALLLCPPEGLAPRRWRCLCCLCYAAYSAYSAYSAYRCLQCLHRFILFQGRALGPKQTRSCLDILHPTPSLWASQAAAAAVMGGVATFPEAKLWGHWKYRSWCKLISIQT